MSTIWDFTADSTSVIKTLRDANPPREQTFDALSLRMVDGIIYLYEAGQYATAVKFEQIGEIDSVEPTDLQDAYDKILAIIPAGGGGGSQDIQSVLDINPRIFTKTIGDSTYSIDFFDDTTNIFKVSVLNNVTGASNDYILDEVDMSSILQGASGEQSEFQNTLTEGFKTRFQNSFGTNTFNANKPRTIAGSATISNPSDLPTGDYHTAMREDLISPFVTITDLAGSKFTDLDTARTWISDYTDNTLFTNEVFANGVYRFTCPIGSDFSLADDFCAVDSSSNTLRFQDNWGLVTLFGNNAFVENNQSNEFCLYTDLSGGITFGDNAFLGATNDNILNGYNAFGDNAFKNAVPLIKNTIKYLGVCGTGFAENYSGSFDINFIGGDGTATLPSDIFTTTNIVLIVTDYSNKFNNSGDIDADILNIIANITDSNSVVSFDGLDNNVIENSTTIALSLSDLNTNYPYARVPFEVVCADIIIGGAVVYNKTPSGWRVTPTVIVS